MNTLGLLNNLSLAVANPVEHVIDHPLITSADGKQWYVSNVTVMLVLSAILTATVLIIAARRITTGSGDSIDDLRAKGLLANFVEFICLYFREEIFRPLLKEQTDRFAPMLWTFFWFILFCNVLGLIPLADFTGLIFLKLGLNAQHHYHGIGGTATQSIWVTAALAIVSFLFYNASGLLKDPKGYFMHLTGGVTPWLWPLMIPVELIGTFVKPFALALRLFANMTGGHIIIAAFLGFVPMIIAGLGWAIGGPLAVVPIAGAVAINILEVLVAFIQAFIFTFLSTVFLSQLVVHEHAHDEHEHDHHDHAGHDHDHKHAHAH